MKECRYCRTKYDDNLAVCPNCGGAKVITADEIAEEAAIKRREAEYREKANTAAKVPKKQLIGISVAVVVVIIAVIAVISINANKPLSNGMTKDEGEEVLATGIAHLDKGEYEAAMVCFLRLPPDSKQYAKAQSLLVKAQDSYRSEILNRVNSHVTNKEYDAAFNLISKAQELLPDDSELKSAYDDTYSAYRSSVMEQADSYVSNGQYELALEYLSYNQSRFPNDASLQDSYNSALLAYHTAVRKEAILQAEAFLADDNFEDAIKTINTALGKIGQDGELSARLNTYQNAYINQVMVQIDSIYIPYNYESLKNSEIIVQNALNVLPNNQMLVAKLYELKELEPIRVINIAYDSLGGIRLEPPALDNKGNQYSYVIGFDLNGGYDYYVEETIEGVSVNIDLDYQYTRISGILFQSESYSGAPTSTSFLVYTANATSKRFEPYEGWTQLASCFVSGDSAPQAFSADISKMKYLHLEYRSNADVFDFIDESVPYAYVADLYLWK